MYTPDVLGAATDSAAMLLANHAWNGRLTLYAGAGVSAADPTALPGATGLARLIAGALDGQISLDGVDHDDLLAVADAVAAQPLGNQLLRRTILEVADFRGAEPNYSHAVLGLLLCEGVVTVLETNYDDCIERAAHPERPVVVRTASELIGSTGACLLKAHGCATLAQTMLVTTADLDAVPTWAESLVQSTLFRDLVAFIGLGSPADYVKDSIIAAMAQIGVDHVLVVDPALADWETNDENAWRKLIADLPADNRDSRTAEEFCDGLMRAYLHRPRHDARTAVASMSGHPQQSGLELVLGALESMDGVSALRWLRSAAYKLTPGMSAAMAPRTVEGLLGVGALLGASSGVEVSDGGWLTVSSTHEASDPSVVDQSAVGDPADAAAPADADPHPQTSVVVLVSHGTTVGTDVAVEAKRRIERARTSSLIADGQLVIVVAVGHMGPMSDEVDAHRGDRVADLLATAEASSTALPEHIVEGVDSAHLISGSMSEPFILVDGHRLIEAA